jgi:hypothetical protein
MRETFRLDRAAPAPSSYASETTNSSFRAACYTALSMFGLMSTSLAVTAYYAAKRVVGVQLSTPWATVWQSYGTYVALLAVFAYAVLAWLFILVWIHAYWPDGWIYQRRVSKRQIQGGGGGVGMGSPEPLTEGAQPMGVSQPMPAYPMNGNLGQDSDSLDGYPPVNERPR